MLSEFGEEYLQEVLTPVFENIALGSSNEVSLFSSDAFYAGILGSLTAGMFEGPTTIHSEIGTYKQGKQLQKSGVTGTRLAEIGKTYAADTVAYQLAGRVETKGDKKTGAYTIGRLFNEIDATLTEQNLTDITDSLVSKGMPEDIARKNAEIMAYIMDGGEVSDIQRKMMEKNEILAQTMQEVLIDQNSTVNQRRHAMNQVEQDLERGAPPQSSSPLSTDNVDTVPNSENSQVNPTENVPNSVKNVDTSSQSTTAEGTAVQASTGEPITPKKISSIQGGKVTVETADGKTVDASDVTHNDAGYDRAFHTITSVANMTAPAANTIMREYENVAGQMDADVFSTAAATAYTYGFYGRSTDLLKQKLGPTALNPKTVSAIYDMGRQAAQSGVKAQVAATTSTSSAKPVRRKHGTVKGYGVKVDDIDRAFNKTQRQAFRALNVLAELTGVDIVLYQSDVDADGNLVGKVVEGVDLTNAQGGFSWANNKMYIDINAGLVNKSNMDDVAKYSMLRTFTHEFVHFIEKWNAAEYDNLRAVVFDEMERKGLDPDDRIAEVMEENKKLSEDDASREVVAEALVDILPQSSFAENLANKHKNLFDKLREKLKTYVENLKAYFRTMSRSTSTVEATTIKENVEGTLKYAQSIVEVFDRAAEGAVETYQQAEKNTAQNGGGKVQYQAHSPKYDYTKSFAEQLDDYLNGKFPARDTFLLGATPPVLKKIGLAALPLTMNREHVDYSLNGTYPGPADRVKDHLLSKEALSQIPSRIADPVAVIQNRQPWQKKAAEYSVVVLVDLEINGKKTLIPINVNSRGYINGIEIDANRLQTIHGNKESVQMLVNALNEDSPNNHSVYYINKNKATAFLRPAGNPISRTAQELDGYIHSVTDKGSHVKMRMTSVTESQQFKRWFGDWKNHPHNASKVVNADGTPKVMYHGKETFRLDDFPFVFHTPDHCRELLGKAGIHICHEVASDGASELLQDLVNGLDKASYQQYLRYHFYICEKPEFLGMSNHLLFVGR